MYIYMKRGMNAIKYRYDIGIIDRIGMHDLKYILERVGGRVRLKSTHRVALNRHSLHSSFVVSPYILRPLMGA